MDSLRTEKLGEGIVVEIHQDEDPFDPREGMCQLGTMVTWHSRYTLGDRQIKSGEYNSPEDVIAGVIEEEGDLAAQLPLYLFDHSGITMSTTSGLFRAVDSAGWDWGVVGFIYVSKAKTAEEGIDDDAKAAEILEAEVKEYDQYLTGDVYGYVIKKDGEVLESCWGFYGDVDDCLEEGKRDAEWYVEKEQGPQPVLGVLLPL